MKRPRQKASAAVVNEEQKADLLLKERRSERLRIANSAMSLLVTGFRSAKPGKCKWLSRETAILPEIVNIVFTVTFQSDDFKTPLDMIRMAQFLPNCKFRPPSFPSATLRIRPITALVYQESNAVIIKTTSPGEALYQSHVLRHLLEQIPFILKYTGKPELFVGTLEGRMGFKRGKIDNIVGSGMLYQDGVHLTNLLHAKDSNVDFDPGAFPNAIYRNVLPDGTPFCCNIANTQKIVVMGAKRVRAMFEAYKMTCSVVNDFEDPDVPKDPQLRRQYRLNQLSARNEILLLDSAVLASSAAAAAASSSNGISVTGTSVQQLFDHDQVERIARMTRGDRTDGAGEEDDEYDPLEAVTQHMRTINLLFDQRRQTNPVPVHANTLPIDTSMRGLLATAARSEQVSNVRHMLTDTSPEMISAVWQRDPQSGMTLLDEMVASQHEKHKEIMHIFKQFMAAHPCPQ